jgi:tRNA wybutosine-synthesizing protein 1
MLIPVVYASLTGTSKKLASKAAKILSAEFSELSFSAVAANDLDPEDLNKESCVLFVFSSHSGGKPPKSGAFFMEWLQEAALDFRVGVNWLKGFKFAVFGVGHSAYDSDFNAAAKALDSVLSAHGGGKLHKVTLGDVAVDVDGQFDEWLDEIINILHDSQGSSNAGVEDEAQQTEGGLMDLEDLATMLSKQGSTEDEDKREEMKEMVTPLIRKSLTKQGYKVLGSHSGVKICRWTKAMLRGRGGCYKHTFYGISSFQCMEMTPSLACANKCVFCWRHHSNPVGKEWKWKMDEPDFIIDEAIENHRKMMKQMKGVPGVLPERYAESMNVKHCALSLVGEPIMYPKINELLGSLHSKGISTFLVTNAQFPDAIRNLDPITQLYVSIDAATKDALKEVDRPLFQDFWERFIDSLKALGEKKQRNVYRLTLVKGYNMEDLEAYAKLIEMANPEFIEIKGVTYCGNSDASTLTMGNVPFYEEVRQFCLDLCKILGDDRYGLACEHVHSCCVLIADRKFHIEGKWHTWIDYPKFQQLIESGDKNFSSLDYIAPTPDWAVFGDEREGFDPQETRFRRKQKSAAVEAQ